MAISDALAPAKGIFSGGLQTIGKYWWVLIVILVVGMIVGVFVIIKSFKDKKNQWTHKLRIRRELPGGRLEDPVYVNMKRFAKVKRANVFELERPVLGCFLLPELSEYSAVNQYSIIIRLNNRIYENKGEFLDVDKSSINVSAKHAEIDIERENLKADFQEVNKKSKRVELAEIIKHVAHVVVAIMIGIVCIVAIQNWSETQKYASEKASAEAAAMDSLSEAMITVDATVNTQKLEILPLLQDIYKTKNIQGIINENTSKIIE